MIGELSTVMMNRYTSDPKARVYQAVKALFLISGESPQEIMDHGAEWIGPSGRIEFMTLVDNCPRLAQAWYDACCSALVKDRPFALKWRTDMTVWRPGDGAGNLDSRCKVEVDDEAEKVRIKITTPVLDVRELASYAKT